MAMLNRREMVLGAASSASLLGLTTNLNAQGIGQYRETNVGPNAAKLSGTITYSGEVYDVPQILVTKDFSICGDGFREPQRLRVSDEGTLGDVVVQIRGITEGKPWAPVFDEARIYQIDCSFQPYVQIIKDTADVYVVNYDPILHNIHAYEVYEGTRRSMFNFSQPNAMQEDRIPLSLRRGNLITIDCNAHGWMASWLYTSPNPYITVTGSDGQFELPDVPPGQYELVIWHPILGEKTVNVDVGENAELQLNLVWA